MTLETVVMLLAFTIFAFCSVLFIIRATAASSFRYKVAAPRNFAEGAAIGIAYPLWIATYGMLFIQCAAFMAFPTTDELSLNYRVIVFIATLLLFFILRACNLPLLAVWFGKTGIWISHGAKGLIRFENITSCEILTQKKLHPSDPNAMCTLVFFAKNKKQFFHTRRFVCKISARELDLYMEKLPIISNGHARRQGTTGKKAILCLLSYLCAAISVFGSVCFLFSTSVLSPYTYTENTEAQKSEFITFAPITDAMGANDMIITRHGSVELINVYSEETGQPVWSLSREKALFPKPNDGISIYENILRYTVNGKDRFFIVENGTELSAEETAGLPFPSPNELTAIDFEFHPLYIRKQLSDRSYRYIVNNPAYYILFVPGVAWGILLFGLIALFTLRKVTEMQTAPESVSKTDTETPTDNATVKSPQADIVTETASEPPSLHENDGVPSDTE